MKNSKLLTTGEFAKLHKINKRTLHYYDEINLIKPSVVGENGYRYYTYYQSIELELILVMRELGLSLEEIKEYKEDKTVDKLTELFTSQVALLDKTITKLSNAKNYINGKLSQLMMLDKIVVDKIEIVELKETKLIISEKYKNDTNEEYFRLMESFNSIAKNEPKISNEFGSRISVENIYNNKLSSYDCFFMSVLPEKTTIEAKDKIWFDIKPAGKYIRVYTRGNWNKIMEIYKKILVYTKENNLVLEGYGYEIGFNELNCFDINDYITEITVKIKED